MTPPPLTMPQLVAVLKRVATLERWEQEEIGNQAAAMIRDLDTRLQDACSMVLSDKPMCIACFETEPHTGHCGSTDPRALCNQQAATPTTMGNTTLLRDHPPAVTATSELRPFKDQVGRWPKVT